MESPSHQDGHTIAIRACTVSRDVQDFDLLIEDMETLLGEKWGDLGFDEILPFLSQPESADLEFIAIAVGAQDGDDDTRLENIVAAARDRKIKVILITDDVAPAVLHKLLRQGADEFLPYPLPEGELQAAVERVRAPAPENAAAIPAENPHTVELKGGGDGVLIAVQSLAGGAGASTIAVNLAYELAQPPSKNATPPRVCLIDLGLQFGSVATYLDLPRREAVLELLSDIDAMDGDSFAQALVPFEDRLKVLTSPADLLPLDMIGPDEVRKILDVAREHFDFVVVDMPGSIVQWTETVLKDSQIFFAITDMDMRSAQNIQRLKLALKAEDLPFEKLRFVLNRAPKFTDLQGKGRIKRMAEGLDIKLDLQMPDGGKVVVQSCDHGLPLANHAPKNPLRKELAKLARSLQDIGQSDAEAA